MEKEQLKVGQKYRINADEPTGAPFRAGDIVVFERFDSDGDPEVRIFHRASGHPAKFPWQDNDTWCVGPKFLDEMSTGPIRLDAYSIPKGTLVTCRKSFTGKYASSFTQGKELVFLGLDSSDDVRLGEPGSRSRLSDDCTPAELADYFVLAAEYEAPKSARPTRTRQAAPDRESCSTCSGSGFVKKGFFRRRKPCAACDGVGFRK